MKKNKELKDKFLSIKVSAKEREEIQKIAKVLGFKSTAQYLLAVAKNQVLFVGPEDPFAELETRISQIRSNINQVVRKADMSNPVVRQEVEEILKTQYTLEAYPQLIKEFYKFEKEMLKGIYKYGDNENSSN